ncbi:MAG TPA: radical SAM protein [Rhodothermales bacterium]|nr:radical SAM protein [Rhodothermales bacterium]
MRKLRIGIIDVLSRSAVTNMYTRTMRANLASIMPQVLAVWCEEEGHDVHLAYYNGYNNMVDPLPDDLDVVFLGTFTQSAQLAYALSAMFRAQGAVTVIGGPQARCYPEDALNYFDYVLGFTDKQILRDVLQDLEPHRPQGVYLTADQQPAELPGVRARWKHIERLLQEAPYLKIVPMIGSLGCPYTCSFCVDSIVPYQPLDFEELKEDLRFIRTKFDEPVVGWHDPNFGVRFDDYLDAIEEAVPPGSVKFIAESTLSLLKEDNVKRLKKNGFKAILPGIESWYDMGNKSKMRNTTGRDKVERVAEQVNMIMRYVPYFQGNFVLGLDCDKGAEPFELTKQFLDLAPGAFPAYSMLTAFGRSAPLNMEYQKQGRVVPFPFHFLNNNGAMNVRPLNYEWTDFYDKMIDLHEHSFSKQAIWRRWRANKGAIPSVMNVIRSVTFEGWGKIKYFKDVRRRLNEDRAFRRFFEQETTEIPPYFVNQIQRDLGPMWDWLPEGALHHDPYAYLKSPAGVKPLMPVAAA